MNPRKIELLIYNTLYMCKPCKSCLRSVFYNKPIFISSFTEMGIMNFIYMNIEGIGKRKIQIHCKITPEFHHIVNQVKALFIFYQPMVVLRHTRVLLAGMLDQLLWIDPYRVRMFPQFRNLLKDKDARAVVGKGL